MKKIISSVTGLLILVYLAIKYDKSEACAILYQNSISKSRLKVFITAKRHLKYIVPVGKERFPSTHKSHNPLKCKGVFLWVRAISGVNWQII